MSESTFIPGLRGVFGDWAYYSCVIQVDYLAKNVLFAKDMYKATPRWSDMLQRELSAERGEEIADYLRENDRFFNAIVIGIYGGSPQWFEINVDAEYPELSNLPEERLRYTLGFVSLSGEEKLYVIDGQHRLFGIKRAISDGTDLSKDEMPVILVSIKDTPSGRIRSRRLFSTVNKKAKTIGLGARIALDEDDATAITTRSLVESGQIFDECTILFSSAASIPPSEKMALTTVGNLYKSIYLLLKGLLRNRGIKSPQQIKALLDGKRPPQETLDDYYKYVLTFFDGLCEKFSELDQYICSCSPDIPIAQYRGKHGGHILFRPIGIELFSRIFSELRGTTDERLDILSQLPVNIAQPPYLDVIWNNRRNIIIKSNNSQMLYILREMCGIPLTVKQQQSLARLRTDIEHR